jgi:hypothetical protein
MRLDLIDKFCLDLQLTSRAQSRFAPSGLHCVRPGPSEYAHQRLSRALLLARTASMKGFFWAVWDRAARRVPTVPRTPSSRGRSVANTIVSYPAQLKGNAIVAVSWRVEAIDRCCSPTDGCGDLLVAGRNRLS